MVCNVTKNILVYNLKKNVIVMQNKYEKIIIFFSNVNSVKLEKKDIKKE